MKKIIVVVTGIIVLCASCVSLKDREMTSTERAQAQVLGKVTAEFNSWQFCHIIAKNNIKRKAYYALVNEAAKRYTGNFEIRNITITGSASGLQFFNVLASGGGVTGGVFTGIKADSAVASVFIGLGSFIISGNTQRIYTTGDVVLFGSGTETLRSNQQGRTNQSGTGTAQTNLRMEEALNKTAAELIAKIPADTTIAILGVYSADSGIADYVIDALEYRFFNTRKFNIVARSRLEQIRREQIFQPSGAVIDSSAVSIGKTLGTGVVITGRVGGSGDSRYLSFKALDVSTAQIITMGIEMF